MAAAAPLASTARLSPPRGITPVPNFGRIECETASGVPVPSGNVNEALMTPHFRSAIVAS